MLGVRESLLDLTPVQSCETRNNIKQLQSRPGSLQFINFPRFKENIQFEWEEASQHHSATDQFAKSYSSLRKQSSCKYIKHKKGTSPVPLPPKIPLSLCRVLAFIEFTLEQTIIIRACTVRHSSRWGVVHLGRRQFRWAEFKCFQVLKKKCLM